MVRLGCQAPADDFTRGHQLVEADEGPEDREHAARAVDAPDLKLLGVDPKPGKARFDRNRQLWPFELTRPAAEWLAEKGYDPQLGARPLRRAIQRLLEDPLSERVLHREFPAGSTILVDIDEDDDERLSFESIETPDQPPVELADNER